MCKGYRLKHLLLATVVFILLFGEVEEDFNNEIKLDKIDQKYKYYKPQFLDQSLTLEENVAILINYFIQKEFEDDIPILPPKINILRGDEERLELYKNRVLKANAKRIAIAQKYNKLLEYKKKHIHQIVHKALSKSFGIVYGKPILTNFKYDTNRGLLLAKFTTSYKNIDEQVAIKISQKEYKKIEKDLKYSTPKVILNYEDHLVDIKTIILNLRYKNYFGKLIKPKFKTIKARIVVDFSKYKKLY